MPSHEPKHGNFFKFGKDDIFNNRIKTFPKVEFFIYSGSVYFNNESQNATNFHIPDGHQNLHELNVYRNLHSSSTDTQLIYPFVTKKGSFTAFKTVTTDQFNQDYVAGDEIAGEYPLTASISIDRYGTSMDTGKKRVLYALRNALDYHSYLSPHYAYSSSFGDKETQILNLVSVPSIFYGSSIQKGSVILKYYVTGTLLAEASDTLKNGQLIQTTGSTSAGISVGDAVGVVLYDEGFIMLTSSVRLGAHQEAYVGDAANASWQYYGITGSAVYSSSYSLKFNGTNYIETITMFAQAKRGEINFSNNPTFLATSSISAETGSSGYFENTKTQIKNIVSSSYAGHSASFKPTTYISKIGIYDKDRNLIAIAGLANPVKKTEDKNFTFKLKLDI